MTDALFQFLRWWRSEDFGLWIRPRFGIYAYSERLRFRFSWGPYFTGGWRPSFRRLRHVGIVKRCDEKCWQTGHCTGACRA